MREILFRGKREDNGRWIKGDYQHFLCENDIYVYIGRWGEEMRSVKPETVGQFTGLIDNNGEKIFEGDIIRAKIEEGNHEGFTWPDMPVGFQQGSFCLNDRNGYVFCVLGAFAASVTFEVIGNIHDNPELL